MPARSWPERREPACSSMSTGRLAPIVPRPELARVLPEIPSLARPIGPPCSTWSRSSPGARPNRSADARRRATGSRSRGDARTRGRATRCRAMALDEIRAVGGDRRRMGRAEGRRRRRPLPGASRPGRGRGGRWRAVSPHRGDPRARGRSGQARSSSWRLRDGPARAVRSSGSSRATSARSGAVRRRRRRRPGRVRGARSARTRASGPARSPRAGPERLAEVEARGSASSTGPTGIATLLASIADRLERADLARPTGSATAPRRSLATALRATWPACARAPTAGALELAGCALPRASRAPRGSRRPSRRGRTD